MTAPTSDLERAKAELKQRFITMMIQKKDKTDKIEKLLKESSNYQNLLVAATSDLMQHYQSAGVGDTREVRESTSKTAQSQVDKTISEVRGSLDEGLQERIQQDHQQIELVRSGVVEATRKADAALVAVADLEDQEFLTNPATAGLIKIKLDESKLRTLAGDMHEQNERLDKRVKALNSIVGSTDQDKVRKTLREVESKISEIQKEIGSLTRKVTDTLAQTRVTIDDKALNAYVASVIKDGDLADLEKLKKLVSKIISVVGGLFKATEATNTINRAAELVNTGVFAGLRQRAIDKQGRTERGLKTEEELRSEHTKDPLLLAREMFEQQKIALDLLTQSLGLVLSGALIPAHGAGEIVMKIWDPIVSAIGVGLTTRMEARLNEAEKALAAKDPVKLAELQTDQQRQLEGQVEDVVKDAVEKGADTLKDIAFEGKSITEMAAEIADDPSDFVSTVLGWIMEPLMTKVWQIFPPKPAQTVTGDDLTRMLDQLHVAQIPSSMLVVAPPPREPMPTTKPDTVPTGLPEKVWAAVLAVNEARSTGQDGAKVHYVKVANPAFGGVEVWGELTAAGLFTPQQLDPGAIETWAERTVAGTGYSDGPLTTPPGVTGSWQVVAVGQFHYVCLTEGSGARHWGGRMDNTKGVRGTSSLLGTVVERLTATTEATMAAFTIG